MRLPGCPHLGQGLRGGVVMLLDVQDEPGDDEHDDGCVACEG
jgi:hypothetical protein